MQSFTRYNPTKVLFGKGATVEIRKSKLIPQDARVLVLCGAGGSAGRNGALEAVLAALPTPPVLVLHAVTPNPTSELCASVATQAVAAGPIDWIVAIGGGSVIDAAKFVAVCIDWIARKRSDDPFDCVVHWAAYEAEYEPRPAAHIAAVVTLPASGSETNASCVISHTQSRRKLTLTHPSLAPEFAVLDPAFTATLPAHLIACGIADTFAHVLEQYAAHPPSLAWTLQDRQAEALLSTLLEVAQPALQPAQQDAAAVARATLLWTATQAQDGLIASGVDCCWGAHQIAHEITAFYGVEHAQAVAILVPAVLAFELAQGSRKEKLAQCARRVFGIVADGIDDANLAQQAIHKIVAFFTQTLGLKQKLSECGVDDSHFEEIVSRFAFMPLGSECNIDEEAIKGILCASL